MKSNFHESRRNRAERAKNLSEKNDRKSKPLFDTANEMSQIIPFGQPILVGHHSEKRHRKHLKTVHSMLGRAFDAQDKALYYSKRADTIENNRVIFSDDPEAIAKLEIELKNLKSSHAFMKAANRFVKAKDREGFLKLEGTTVEIWDEVTTDRFGYIGFGLGNSNQNIRRIERRLAELRKMIGKTTQEILIGNVRLVENVEANRVQMIFPARVSREVYKQIRKLGFVCCKSEGAFQRKLNPYAVSIARNFLENYDK